MNRKIRGAASACLGLLLPALALAAPAAHAGTYSVATCRGPVSGVAPIGDAFGGWRHEYGPSASGGLTFRDACLTGEHLGVDVGGAATFPAGYASSQAVFHPPVDTRVKGFEVQWEGYAVGADANKTGRVLLETDSQRYAEYASSGRLNPRWTTATNIDASYVRLYAGCLNGGALCGGTSPGGDAWARMLRATLALGDEYTPGGVVFGAGTSSTEWNGPQTLTVDTEDRGGGVFVVAVEVDGERGADEPVDANGGRCVPASDEPRTFLYPRPCLVDPAAKDVAVDVAAFPDGEHDVRVLVEDAAGNVRPLPVGRKLFDTHAPVLDGTAAVAGTGREGELLTCTSPVVTGQDPQIRFTWSRTNADGTGRVGIDGATAQTYTPTAADVGRKLLCAIIATDGGGTATSESSPTSGPFSDGRTVRGICDGMATGQFDPCGDLDKDGRRNRDDDDADGDGVPRSTDPDDHNAAATGRDTATPSSVHTSTTTTTHTTETIRETLTVPDGPAGQVNGTLGGPGASLTVHHEGTSSRTIRVSHGRRVIIEGRLRAPDGRGITGGKLEISTQDRATGSPVVPFGSVATGVDGVYRVILPAGPSRTVRVGYRARFGDSTFSQTSEVTVLVRAGLRFKLSRRTLRNGQSVRYTGRLLGPRTSHRFVEVQVRTGRRWIVVCSVRTDTRGSYGCAHRFTKTFRRTRYVFRARVRRQTALPYEPVTSSARALTVRP